MLLSDPHYRLIKNHLTYLHGSEEPRGLEIQDFSWVYSAWSCPPFILSAPDGWPFKLIIDTAGLTWAGPNLNTLLIRKFRRDSRPRRRESTLNFLRETFQKWFARLEPYACILFSNLAKLFKNTTIRRLSYHSSKTHNTKHTFHST